MGWLDLMGKNEMKLQQFTVSPRFKVSAILRDHQVTTPDKRQ